MANKNQTPNKRKSTGGADIADVNNLHDKLVQAAHSALDEEVSRGEVKASTLSAVRQICADAGIQPTVEASQAMENLLWALPSINPDQVAQAMNR